MTMGRNISRARVNNSVTDMAKPYEVLVVGAGLGGLATALVLAKDGYRVRVLEAAKTFGEVR
jgi:monoamine oxidase